MYEVPLGNKGVSFSKDKKTKSFLKSLTIQVIFTNQDDLYQTI